MDQEQGFETTEFADQNSNVKSFVLNSDYGLYAGKQGQSSAIDFYKPSESKGEEGDWNMALN
jgi:hypothetical protein